MQHYFNPAKTARPNRWYAPVSTSQRIFGKSEYLDVLIIKIKKKQDSMVCLEIQARIKNRKKHQARSRREFWPLKVLLCSLFCSVEDDFKNAKWMMTSEILKEVQESNAWNGVTIFWSDFLACQEIFTLWTWELNHTKSGLGTLHSTVQFICIQKLDLHAIQLWGSKAPAGCHQEPPGSGKQWGRCPGPGSSWGDPVSKLFWIH